LPLHPKLGKILLMPQIGSEKHCLFMVILLRAGSIFIGDRNSDRIYRNTKEETLKNNYI